MSDVDQIIAQLKQADIKDVEVVYDQENDIYRFYKRSMALEIKINPGDSLLKVAHRLGWHKFD